MSKRNVSIDLLKLILAIFVVLLHSNFANDYNKIIHFLTVEGVLRIAVPIFFIINGYYFKSVIDNKSLKKWIIRASILYFFWMLIYLPIWFDLSIKSFLKNIIIGFHHLWYINTMIFCGISLYLIKKVTTKKLLIIAMSLFAVGITIQYSGNFHIFKNFTIDKLTNTTYIYRNFLFFGLPFFLIGYLIRRSNWEKKISTKQNILLILLSTVFLFMESFFNFIYTKEGVDILFSLLILCPLIFIFSIKKQINYKINSKNIALLSTAVYLIHPWIIDICKLCLITNTFLLAIIAIIASLIISIVIIKINTKVKFIL